MFKTLEELITLASSSLDSNDIQYWISTDDNGFSPIRYKPRFDYNIYFLLDIFIGIESTRYYYIEYFREEAIARTAERMVYNKKYLSFIQLL